VSGPDPYPVEPLPRPVDAVVAPPGSKSITCRAVLLAALARGRSTLARPLLADDTVRLLEAVDALGASAERLGETVAIDGVDGRFPRGGDVFLGDGGTPARFMIAAAALAADEVVVDGSPRMRERPVGGLVDLLRRLGASIECPRAEGRLPVRVTPTPSFAGGEIEVGATASSQFVSALLLVGRRLERGLRLRLAAPLTSATYVALTIDVLREWGVDVGGGAAPGVGDVLTIEPGPLGGRAAEVPPDASSCVYWFVAAALTGSTVTVPGLAGGPPQPDLAVAAALERAGGGTIGAQAGDVVFTGTGGLRGFDLDAAGCPDGALALAAAAAAADGPSRLTGLGTLRVKESDRIAALTSELERLGCAVRATDESIEIDPGRRHERPVTIETWTDHRLAMAFAALGLARPGISIRDPGCVSKSYPGFWHDLERFRAT
jgi:3-phosphoshikimate 1-carboxyvinyltransferase